MQSFFEKLAKLTLKDLIKKTINTVFHKRKDKNSESKEILKNHPWRLCPVYEHWVSSHEKNLKSGTITHHDGHCRKNSKRKSEFYTAEELRVIAETYFDSLANNLDFMPVPNNLGFPNGNRYDLLIAGWTKFWNDILKPEDPLTPNFVKALVATESSFSIPKDQKSSDGLARGPIQVTEETRKTLQNLKGELKNHYIELTTDESREPVTNIAAGIRWLHHKKFLLEHRIKRKATWEEVIAEYKGIYSQIGKYKKADKIMNDLKDYYYKLKIKSKK